MGSDTNAHSKIWGCTNKQDNKCICIYCKNIRETSEHYLGKCQAYLNIRVQCFGKDNISIKEIIEKTKLQDILEFINHTKGMDRKIKD